MISNSSCKYCAILNIYKYIVLHFSHTMISIFTNEYENISYNLYEQRWISFMILSSEFYKYISTFLFLSSLFQSVMKIVYNNNVQYYHLILGYYFNDIKLNNFIFWNWNNDNIIFLVFSLKILLFWIMNVWKCLS